jgi:pimeloyl-ACP methyl ester carboxylesterase
VTARRTILTGLAGVAPAGGAWGLGAYSATMTGAEARTERRSIVIPTGAGPLEYAVAGTGPERLMMSHGTGGGFDQGLLSAHGLRQAGFRIVAPSRFGYLESAFPDDASPVRQADVLVGLLDHLSLDRIAVEGGSAGALTAANLTGRDPVAFFALQRIAVERVLTSNAWFRGFATIAPDGLPRMLLAADPALLDRVSSEERRRGDLIRQGPMPVGRRTRGLRTDRHRTGTPTQTAFEDIAAPTLILCCEDDLFGAAAGRPHPRRAARRLSRSRACLARPRRRVGARHFRSRDPGGACLTP